LVGIRSETIDVQGYAVIENPDTGTHHGMAAAKRVQASPPQQPNAKRFGDLLLLGPDTVLDRKMWADHPMVLSEKSALDVRPLNGLPRGEADALQRCPG